MNVNRMIERGLIPMTREQFNKTFEQGDVFLLQLNGQVNVMAKLNRATKNTMAFHCPRIVQMPTWDVDGSTTVEQPAVMLGYTGIRLGKDESVQNLNGHPMTTIPVPQTPPLAPRLDTPSNRRMEGSIWVREIESITRARGGGYNIDYIK